MSRIAASNRSITDNAPSVSNQTKTLLRTALIVPRLSAKTLPATNCPDLPRSPARSASLGGFGCLANAGQGRHHPWIASLFKAAISM